MPNSSPNTSPNNYTYTSLIDAFNEVRINYQKRYYNYYTSDEHIGRSEWVAHGHIEECEYVLHKIFGLTDEQLREVIYNHGYTNDDWGINI